MFQLVSPRLQCFPLRPQSSNVRHIHPARSSRWINANRIDRLITLKRHRIIVRLAVMFWLKEYRARRSEPVLTFAPPRTPARRRTKSNQWLA